MDRGERKKVLVIDDDERVLIALDGALEMAGFACCTAWGGQEALQLLGSNAFDLVLLDDYLPDVATEEVLRQVQAVSVKPPVVILQTARLTDQETARLLRLGARCFVNKWKPDEVAQSVRKYLSRLEAIAA